MYEFKLPDLGEGVHEGEILKWYVGVGETIEEDASLVEVETDKAAVTIPSPVAGKIVSVSGEVGDVVIVGNVIAVIDDGSGGAEALPKPPAAEKADTPATTATMTPAPSTGGPVPAAPATRRLARELGANLSEVTATGPAGRVTPEDVKAHAQKGPASSKPTTDTVSGAAVEHAAHGSNHIPFLDLDPLPDFSEFGEVQTEKLRSIRRKVAHRMVTSKILVPHVCHMDEADVTDLEEFRVRSRQIHEDGPGAKLTLLAFVVKAVTAGLKSIPALNASIDPFEEEIIYKKFYNVGIAVDTQKGLVVPVVKDTDRKSILQISADIGDVAKRGRDGKLEVSDLKGGTFTITNMGPLGGTNLIPAINYPEVAILGMGKVEPKPVVRDGEIVIRKILPLSLSFDHRIADGGEAARFVGGLVRQLSDPHSLLVES